MIQSHSVKSNPQEFNMDKALKQLIDISTTLGTDPSLVSGASGNTSVKTDDGSFIYIKASGTPLKDMTPKKGYRKLQLDRSIEIIADTSLAKLDVKIVQPVIARRLLKLCDDKFGNTSPPSIELPLHTCLDKYVIHLHPIAVNAYTCSKNGKAKLQKLFESLPLPPLWIPYADPGFHLGQKIFAAVASYKRRFKKLPQIIFLQNHGLIVSANTEKKVLSLARKAIKTCSRGLTKFKKLKPPVIDKKIIANAKKSIRLALLQTTYKNFAVQYFPDPEFFSFMRDQNSKRLLSYGSLTPDEQIYAKGPSVLLNSAQPEDIEKTIRVWMKKWQTKPLAFMLDRIGLFVAASPKSASTINNVVKNSLFIRQNAPQIGQINALNKNHRHFIDLFEADSVKRVLELIEKK